MRTSWENSGFFMTSLAVPIAIALPASDFASIPKKLQIYDAEIIAALPASMSSSADDLAPSVGTSESESKPWSLAHLRR